jgi:hypothetical protein
VTGVARPRSALGRFEVSPPVRRRLRYQYDLGLAHASSEGDVLRIVREYWADVPKWVKCLVPRTCHARLLVGAADVHWWAARLARRFASAPGFEDAARLRELVAFLGEASARLHALEAPADERPCGPTLPASPRRESAAAPTDPRSS